MTDVFTPQTSTQIGIPVGFCAYASPYVISHFPWGWSLIHRLPQSIEWTLFPAVLLTLLGGLGMAIWGCRCYALAKGHSPIWGYLAFVPPVGIIVAFLLRDLHPELDVQDRRGFQVLPVIDRVAKQSEADGTVREA